MSAHPQSLPLPEVKLRETEHRFRNSLQFIASLVRTLSRHAESAEARETLDCVLELVDTLGALETMAATRDPWSGPGDRLEEMSRHWQRLCNGHVEVAVSADKSVSAPQGEMTLLCLVAQELVMNAIKHAFPGDETGAIRVLLVRDAAGYDMLMVEDDGVGCCETGVAGSSADRARPAKAVLHGTALVDSLVSAFGGTIRRERPGDGRGHRVIVSWPEE